MKEGRKHRHETLAVTDKKEKKIIIKKQTNLSKVKLPKTPCSSTLLLSPSVNSDCAFLPSFCKLRTNQKFPPSSPDRNISSLQNHFFILIFIHIIRKRISLSLSLSPLYAEILKRERKKVANRRKWWRWSIRASPSVQLMVRSRTFSFSAFTILT